MEDVEIVDKPKIVFPVLMDVQGRNAMVCPDCFYIFEWVDDISTIPFNTKSYTGTNKQPEWLVRPPKGKP